MVPVNVSLRDIRLQVPTGSATFLNYAVTDLHGLALRRTVTPSFARLAEPPLHDRNEWKADIGADGSIDALPDL